MQKFKLRKLLSLLIASSSIILSNTFVYANVDINNIYTEDSDAYYILGHFYWDGDNNLTYEKGDLWTSPEPYVPNSLYSNNWDDIQVGAGDGPGSLGAYDGYGFEAVSAQWYQGNINSWGYFDGVNPKQDQFGRYRKPVIAKYVRTKSSPAVGKIENISNSVPNGTYKASDDLFWTRPDVPTHVTYKLQQPFISSYNIMLKDYPTASSFKFITGTDEGPSSSPVLSGNSLENISDIARNSVVHASFDRLFDMDGGIYKLSANVSSANGKSVDYSNVGTIRADGKAPTFNKCNMKLEEAQGRVAITLTNVRDLCGNDKETGSGIRTITGHVTPKDKGPFDITFQANGTKYVAYIPLSQLNALAEFDLDVICTDNVNNQSSRNFPDNVLGLKITDYQISDIVYPIQNYTYPLKIDKMPVEMKAGYNATFQCIVKGNPEKNLKVTATFTTDANMPASEIENTFAMTKKDKIGENLYLYECTLTTNMQLPLEALIYSKISAKQGNTTYDYNENNNWDGKSIIIKGHALDDMIIHRSH